MRSKYSKEMLQEHANLSQSYTTFLKSLGLKVTGGNHRNIKILINKFNIDVSHFVQCTKFSGTYKRMTDEELFTINSNKISRKRVVAYLTKCGIQQICQCCGLSNWLNKPITLHIDHINGDITDNRLENLRYLCPNCHQQTPTWGNGQQNKPEKIIDNRTQRWLDKNSDKINAVKNSNIDFTKFGWVGAVSKLINIKHQHVSKWMLRWLPEIYNTAFKRK